MNKNRVGNTGAVPSQIPMTHPPKPDLNLQLFLLPNNYIYTNEQPAPVESSIKIQGNNPKVKVPEFFQEVCSIDEPRRK